MPLLFSRKISVLALTGLLSILPISNGQVTQTGSLFGDMESTAYEDSYPYFLQAEEVIVLGTMTTGLVDTINVLPQDYVSKDQELLKLDSDLVELEIKSLKDQLELNTKPTEAKIRLEFSEDNLKIVEELYNKTIGDTRVGSTKERKEAIQARDLAREGVKQAELETRMLANQLAQKSKVLEYYTVKAPVDGVIVPFSNIKTLENTSVKQIREGEIVQAGQPVMAMLKVDNLRVRFKQSRTELGNIRIGQGALIHIQGFTQPVKANVCYIEPTIIEALDEFYIEVEIRNIAAESTGSKYPFQFLPGMRVRVELQK